MEVAESDDDPKFSLDDDCAKFNVRLHESFSILASATFVVKGTRGDDDVLINVVALLGGLFAKI